MFNIDFSKINASELKKYVKYIVGLVVILLLIAGYFLWLPKYQEFKNTRVELEIENEKVKKKKEYLLELEGNLNLLTDYEEEFLKMSSALPLERNASSLLSFFQRSVSESGMIINSVTLEKATTSSKVLVSQEQGAIKTSEIYFGAEVKGSYLSFKDLLYRLYLSSRMVEVRGIKIEPDENEERSGIYNFDISLKAKYYDQGE